MDVNIYIPEGKPLSDKVQALWQVTRENSYRQEVIVPKGVVEIIFNFDPETPFCASLLEQHGESYDKQTSIGKPAYIFRRARI